MLQNHDSFKKIQTCKLVCTSDFIRIGDKTNPFWVWQLVNLAVRRPLAVKTLVLTMFTFQAPSVPQIAAPISAPTPRESPPTDEEFALAALLSQSTLAKLEYCCELIGITPPPYYRFMKAIKVLEPILRTLADESMNKFRCEEDTDLFVMSDCGWNFRNNRSPLGTVTFLGMKTKKVIAICPLVNRGSEANFAGTSQAMEGEGTLRIAKEMKAAGFVVKKFLHDGDSSSFASILQVFPACQEYSCINHACKNIRKHVKTRIGEAWANKCRNYAWKLMREASAAPSPDDYLYDGLCAMVKHYGGQHEDCTHERVFDPKEAMDEGQVACLKSILEKYSVNLGLYSHGLNQSYCEFFNNVICNFAPNMNVEWAVQRTLNQLNIAVSPSLAVFLSKKSLLQERKAELYQRSGKQQRKNKKAKLFVQTEHTYKDETKCGCQTKEPCGTRSCSCRKSLNACGDSCKCNSACKNRVVRTLATRSSMVLPRKAKGYLAYIC